MSSMNVGSDISSGLAASLWDTGDPEMYHEALRMLYEASTVWKRMLSSLHNAFVVLSDQEEDGLGYDENADSGAVAQCLSVGRLLVCWSPSGDWCELLG